MKLVDLIQKFNKSQVIQALHEFGSGNFVDTDSYAFEELKNIIPTNSEFTISVKKYKDEPLMTLKEFKECIISARKEIENDLTISKDDFRFCLAKQDIPTDEKIIEEEEDMKNDISEYYYDVSGIKPNNPESWAIEFRPWEEWLSMEIDQSSLDEYGEIVCLVAILEEMTFNGFSSIDQKIRSKEMLDTCKDAIDEIKNND